MVEGPGCTRNGRKVQTAVGKTLVATPQVLAAGSNFAESGGASDGMLAPPTLPHHLAGELATYTLQEAFSLGKELFLIFNDDVSGADVGLRLHFGMSGSLNVRKVKSSDLLKKPSGVAPWKQDRKPSLRLYLTDGSHSHFAGPSNYVIVEAWDTTLTFPVSATNSRNKLMENTSRDACSILFNAQDAFTSMRQSGNNLIISDALLNQDIFPGVGNIIKIESLHLGKIDPRRITSSLTDPELRRLIRHTRKFSMDWLKSGRAGPKLVYNQTSCGTCKGMTVKMQKIGGASNDGSNNNVTGKGHAFMSRVTFWCTVCQPLNAPPDNNGSPLTSSGPTTNSIGNGSAPDRTSITTSRPRSQCPQHGSRSMKLCRVRKSTQNALRIFFTCKLRGCQHFEWADSTFSNCRCGKKSILRVSKTERSGGRWFLCCASGDKTAKGGSNGNGCGHFEWAKDDQLAPLNSLLTPLL